jgi:hypothetical protein
MHVVILGGGIAGITCLETLVGFRDQLPEGTQVTIVSASPLLRRAVPFAQLGRHIAAYRLEETGLNAWEAFPWVHVQLGVVEHISVARRYVRLRTRPESATATTDSDSNVTLPFDFLCIAMGATPRIPSAVQEATVLDSVVRERVLTIRDTDSVERFWTLLGQLLSPQHRQSAGDPRIVIVGNGGIAMELAYVLQDVAHIDWVIREEHLGHAFFDARVSQVLWTLPTYRSALRNGVGPWLRSPSSAKASSRASTAVSGAALGPDWMRGGTRDRKHFDHETFVAAIPDDKTPSTQRQDNLSAVQVQKALPELTKPLSEKLRVHRCCTVASVGWRTSQHAETPTTSTEEGSGPQQKDHRLRVVLSQGEALEADLLLCATGVCGVVNPGYFDSEGQKRIQWVRFPTPPLSAKQADCKVGLWKTLEDACDDIGIAVNEQMQTAVTHIYAVGDCCVVQRSSAIEEDAPPLWFQMRLWSQAKMMGARAGRSILRELCAEHRRTQQEVPRECNSSVYGLAKSSTAEVVPCLSDIEPLDMELFCHVTEFCGVKVVLLGLYRVHKLENVHVLESLRPADEEHPTGWQYIRAILYENRLVGAVLLGETGLEGVYEHLMLNRMDVSFLGAALVDGSLELDDYFD